MLLANSASLDNTARGLLPRDLSLLIGEPRYMVAGTLCSEGAAGHGGSCCLDETQNELLESLHHYLRRLQAAKRHNNAGIERFLVNVILPLIRNGAYWYDQ